MSLLLISYAHNDNLFRDVLQNLNNSVSITSYICLIYRDIKLFEVEWNIFASID